MKKEYLTTNSGQTKKLGEKLAREILKKKGKPADSFTTRRACQNTKFLAGKTALVIGLGGELGAGKTTFLQGFARGLRIKEKILSPTFVILKKFEITNKNFYHIDCYRIKKPKELFDLGFKKIIFDPKNIIAIEWADRVKKIMPKNAIWIRFKFVDEKTRKISIN